MPYATDTLVVERDVHEVRLVGATGIVPNSGSVMPMRRKLARLLGTHPRKIAMPVKLQQTGSVLLLRSPIPDRLSVDEVEAFFWESVAAEGDKLEPLVTRARSNFGSKRRHPVEKKPHETPLPRLTRPAANFH